MKNTTTKNKQIALMLLLFLLIGGGIMYYWYHSVPLQQKSITYQTIPKAPPTIKKTSPSENTILTIIKENFAKSMQKIKKFFADISRKISGVPNKKYERNTLKHPVDRQSKPKNPTVVPEKPSVAVSQEEKKKSKEQGDEEPNNTQSTALATSQKSEKKTDKLNPETKIIPETPTETLSQEKDTTGKQKQRNKKPNNTQSTALATSQKSEKKTDKLNPETKIVPETPPETLSQEKDTTSKQKQQNKKPNNTQSTALATSQKSEKKTDKLNPETKIIPETPPETLSQEKDTTSKQKQHFTINFNNSFFDKKTWLRRASSFITISIWPTVLIVIVVAIKGDVDLHQWGIIKIEQIIKPLILLLLALLIAKHQIPLLLNSQKKKVSIQPGPNILRDLREAGLLSEPHAPEKTLMIQKSTLTSDETSKIKPGYLF